MLRTKDHARRRFKTHVYYKLSVSWLYTTDNLHI